MMQSQSFETLQASKSYTDINSINTLKTMKDKHEALGEICKQFESMLVRQMLGSMRKANDVFAKDSPFSSNDTKFYQNMMDDQLALSMSTGRGMGIAEAMQRQLSQSLGISEADTVNKPKSFEVRDIPVHSKHSVTERPSEVNAGGSQSQVAAMCFDGKPENFVERLYDMAKGAAEKLGVDPKVLVAQAALETGWGKKISAGSDGKPSFNLFNIKADQRWQGDSVSVSTLEYRNGIAQKEQADFRAYQSFQESFDDYADFVSKSARYQPAVEAKDSETYIHNLAEGGYATDPQYAEKVMRVMANEALQTKEQG